MGAGGVGGVLVLVVAGAVVYGLYWVIRLAVYHGIKDAARYERVFSRDTGAPEVLDRDE
jgi:hypothetical protein